MKISLTNFSNQKRFDSSNLCLKNHQNLSFKRTFKEHRSWGVRLPKDNNSPVSAKIFTYEDAKNVSIKVKNENEEKIYKLDNMGHGVFEKKLPPQTIKHNDKYSFIIEKANGKKIEVKDPYSFNQQELTGMSSAYNHYLYKWHDSDWFNKTNKNRISRQADDKNNLLPLNNATIYEINIATLTKEGNFESAKSALKDIKNDGFNTIELMPVENTYSFNWGYDGVDKFAPSNYLGGPDKLKSFIDYAHKIGLNVIMDMVPNHIGPDGNMLSSSGPYGGPNTDWGEGFNYEGKNSRYVRDYMVNACLNWLHNYHCDGLRLDMTKMMASDTTMQQIAAEVNKHFPDAFLIAEDGRSGINVKNDTFWNDWHQPHDLRVINPLKPEEEGIGEDEIEHNRKIDRIINGKVPLSRLGFDSEWDFYFHHTLLNAAYGAISLDSLEMAVVDSKKRIKYTTSHDEIGNYDGTRVVTKLVANLLNISDSLTLNPQDIKRANELEKKNKISKNDAQFIVKSQKAQLAIHSLVKKFLEGDLDKYKNDPQALQREVLSPLNIQKSANINYFAIKHAYEKALDRYKMVEAIKYFAPGPIMTFQGEQRADITKFNFFREFESIKDENYLYIEKGYPYGKMALDESVMGEINYSNYAKEKMDKFNALISDLNKYKALNPASTTGKIITDDTVKHYQNPTIALHSYDEKTKNETYIIANFSSKDYPSYNIEFPKGIWMEIIDTKDKKYGSNSIGDNMIIEGHGKNAQKSQVALSGNCAVIFKRIK